MPVDVGRPGEPAGVRLLWAAAVDSEHSDLVSCNSCLRKSEGCSPSRRGGASVGGCVTDDGPRAFVGSDGFMERYIQTMFTAIQL